MVNLLKKTAFCLILSLLFGLNAVAPVTGQATQFQLYDTYIEVDNSRPNRPSNWTIEFKNVQEVPVSGRILITPQDGQFTIFAELTHADIDLEIASTDINLAVTAGSGADSAWGVTIVTGTSGSIALINNDTDTIAADTTILIRIGTHATHQEAGEYQIINPAKTAPLGTGDIWRVYVSTRNASNETLDTINLPLATIEHVSSTAGQIPQLSFEINDITPPVNGVISPNAIEWRELTPGTSKTATLRVKVNTSAQNGFTVSLAQNHNMQHTQDPGFDIDPIKNSSVVGTNLEPVAWESPPGTTIAVDTGYFGYTTSDTTLSSIGDGPDRFAGGTLYSGLTSTAEEVLFHDEATQSDINGQDYADVTFQIEVNSLQPTGNYANEIVFTVKPIF